MYCSSDEPSHLEHYRPIAHYPAFAFDYLNFLWVCGICNSENKGDQFPPEFGEGEQILNPLDDYVWDYFFLDENFGRLTKTIDPITLLPKPRAVSTCKVVGIDRGILQRKRAIRHGELIDIASGLLSNYRRGEITQAQVKDRLLGMQTAPFQADVADYFLNGPGRVHEPFRSLLLAAREAVD
jgi:hypothetical protein